MYLSGIREDAAEAPGGVGEEAEDEYQHREEIDQRGLAGKKPSLLLLLSLLSLVWSWSFTRKRI